MTVLNDYSSFRGRHWETGSVANALAHRDVVAPHTGQPYSEALLMGVSGGAVMGYFVFSYEGYDPMARILTRNTFDPLDTLLSRLGIVQTRLHTGSAKKAVANLTNALDEGVAPMVWADMFSLPYNHLEQDEGMWGMYPIVVYGYDISAETVYIADRARVGLTTTPAELAAARGRVKKDKHRVLLLDPPNEEKLNSAVVQGIWDCIKLYTEKPPKGSKNNFGLAAYRAWANDLTKPTARRSWAKEFAPGIDMYAGLTSAFGDITTFGKDGHGERDVYAAFLEEAAVLLEKPALNEVAAQFRESASAYDELALALLPDDVAPFKEARELMLTAHDAFLNEGNSAESQLRTSHDRLAEIRASMATDFPLDDAGVSAVCQRIADQLMVIHDIEQAAIANLREIMGE